MDRMIPATASKMTIAISENPRVFIGLGFACRGLGARLPTPLAPVNARVHTGRYKCHGHFSAAEEAKLVAQLTPAAHAWISASAKLLAAPPEVGCGRISTRLKTAAAFDVTAGTSTQKLVVVAPPPPVVALVFDTVVTSVAVTPLTV